MNRFYKKFNLKKGSKTKNMKAKDPIWIFFYITEEPKRLQDVNGAKCFFFVSAESKRLKAAYGMYGLHSHVLQHKLVSQNMCFSHKIKCQVPYEFTLTNAVGDLYHYPLHNTYMILKSIFNLSNNTWCSFKVFHNKKLGENILLPSTGQYCHFWSIAQPGKIWVFPRFSWAVSNYWQS